jgi:glycosyltransferase involved in cell wall biosynthesis
MGFRNDLERIFADTDIVALTSANEGTPVALIEALAAGCSIVATDVGGVADVLENGRWGRLVGERTPLAIAAALKASLSELPSRSGEAIVAGQRYARTKFGIDRLVRDHVALYETLLIGAGLNAPSP